MKLTRTLLTSLVLALALTIETAAAPMALALEDQSDLSAAGEQAQASPAESPIAAQSEAAGEKLAQVTAADTNGAPAVGSEVVESPRLKAQISNLEDINRQILLKDIELERYSINFRKLNNVQGRWRGWRYFISQEASAGATAGGLVAQMCDRQRLLKHPNVFVIDRRGKVSFQQNRVSRGREEAGLVSQTVGQICGATGSGIELGINMYHEYKARSAGYSPKAGIRKTLAIKAEITDLFAQRRKLLAESNFDAEDLAVANCEEKVLRDLTDMALQEYAGFHAGARRFQAFQDSLFVCDILKNTSGAVANVINIYGLHHRIPREPGPAGVVAAVSSAFMMFTPMISRGCGKVCELQHMRDLRPVLQDTSPHSLENLRQDQKQLAVFMEARQTRLGEPSDTAVNLLAAYDSQSSLKQRQLALATREVRAGTRAASENVASGFAIGSTKLVLSIDNMIAGWRYFRSPMKQNHILQSGIYTYTAGSFFGVGENLRLRVVDEYTRHKLGKQRQLPMQVLGDRLKALDAIEKTLR